MVFKPGENVGPYQIIEQLGQGGMATVFKAYHAALDRYVAIKVLHAAFKEDPNFEKRFQREAKVIAKLEHPNIVPVYDYNEHDGSPYLVMRFIEGETLKARLASGPVGPAEAVAMIDKVGSALTYAHDQGVLHRDIKPSNIMLTDDDKVFLADFGLARIAQAGESTLSQDMMLGTPAYMSPEQARGERELDARTDIYSLGVVLYEMVVGRVPFSADTPYAVIHDHIFSPLPPPRSINPRVPESVERVLLKALAKKRDDRFASAKALAEAFDKAVEAAGAQTFISMAQTMPMEAQPVPPPPPPMPSDASTKHPSPTTPLDEEAGPRRRRWWVWGLVGLGAVAGLCLIVLAIGSSVRQNRQAAEGGVAEGGTAEAEPGNQGEPPPDELPPPREEPPPGQGPPLGELSPDGHCVESGLTLRPIEQAEAQVADFPDNACAHFELAFAYFEAEMGREGIGELQAAVELGLSGETLMFVGNQLMERGNPLEAARFFGLAYEETRSPEAELAAFTALVAPENTPETEETIRALTERFPGLAFPKSALAVTLAERGNIDEAMAFATDAIAVQPESPVAHFTMGRLFLETDRPFQARLQFACVTRALDSPPDLRVQAEELLQQTGGENVQQEPADLGDELPIELQGCPLDRIR